MGYWSADGSSISIRKDVSYMHKLTQIDPCIFFGRHLARLSRLINILRDYLWARNMVIWHWSAGFLFWQLSIDTNIQCHHISCEPFCNLMFTKHTWLRSPYWWDTVVVVWDSTRPWARPLAMLTMKKKNKKQKALGFHNCYAWFLSVFAISIGMGLYFPALLAGEALL